MNSLTCLITGANGGIGKAAALAFARRGAAVILLCRDRGRGEAALADVRSASGSSALELLVADLGSQQSIRQAVRQFSQSHDRLDVLVNNAAVYTRKRTTTPDGLETMFAVNHLGHFLLTHLLMDALRASPSARIVHISAPTTVKLNFEDLQSEQDFSSLTAFGATKMCNLLFAYELARRLEGTGITSNVLHPGLVKSSLMSETPWLMRQVLNIVSRSPENAAQAVVFLATAPELAGVTGQFFRGQRRGDSDPYSRDVEVQRRLWEISARLAGLEQATTA